MKKQIKAMTLAAGAVLAATGAFAENVPAAYRALWNDKLNAEIDARIEKHHKADADGRTATKVIEVK